MPMTISPLFNASELLSSHNKIPMLLRFLMVVRISASLCATNTGEYRTDCDGVNIHS